MTNPIRRLAAARPYLFAFLFLVVVAGGAGGWLFAQGAIFPNRLNGTGERATDDARANAPVRVLGRDGGGDVITNGDTRTIAMYFVNFELGESITLPNGADIDVSTVVISNGNLQTTEYAVGGIFIQNAQQIPYVFYALDSFGTTAHTFDPPLPLREGDSVVVIPASGTTNVEWDITLHGRVPSTTRQQPSGVIAR